MITYSIGGTKFLPKTWKFPAGEVGIRVHPHAVREGVARVSISASIQNSDGVMELLMLTDALKRYFLNASLVLELGYLPYGRQDRVCFEGESLSLKVFANLINSQNYKEVIIYDPHSSVTEAVFNSAVVVSGADVFGAYIHKIVDILPNTVVVAPDVGALKKVLEIKGRHSQFQGVCVASKIRDQEDGSILQYKFDGDVRGKICVVVDDILDGGATFQHIARALREGGAAKTILFVTHGVFSKGHKCVASLFDEVYTTNSYHNDRLGDVDGVTYFKLI